MPKPITAEMLGAMTPAQIATLHSNASSRDTPAARDLLQLLDAGGFVKPSKEAKPLAPTRKVAGLKAAKAAAPRKAAPVAHGRRA